MSHFVTTVLIPASTLSEFVESAVASLLEPYNENIEVEEYDTDCSCLNSIARRAGMDAADQEIGTLNELREQYWALPEAERPDQSEFFAAYEATAARIEQSHPLYQKPDPDCKYCQGTGTCLTTYNPDSQWDWWVIGGRWDGWLNSKNIAPATTLLENTDKIPFAVVTPDGQWHQKGEMGWFGIANDEKADKTWAKEVHSLLQTHSDFLAVTCDLHI